MNEKSKQDKKKDQINLIDVQRKVRRMKMMMIIIDGEFGGV